MDERVDLNTKVSDCAAEITIRAAVATDEGALQAVLANIPEAAQWNPWSAAGRGWYCRVAELGGRVCGFIAFRTVADEAEILNLGVEEGQRRRGIASRLIDEVVKECEEVGVRKVFLEVRESNAGARMFYAARRFTVRDQRRAYYRRPTEDALVLVRVIE